MDHRMSTDTKILKENTKSKNEGRTKEKNTDADEME